MDLAIGGITYRQEDYPLVQGMIYACFITLVLMIGAVLATRCFFKKSKQDAGGPRYWHPGLKRWIYSNTPLCFTVLPINSTEMLDIAYVYQGSTIARIQCRLADLLKRYSSYFHHLYDTCGGSTVVMQQRIFNDFRDRFAPEHVAEAVNWLVNGGPYPATSNPCIQYLGLPTTNNTLLYEDWVEQQSEALYCWPDIHPLFVLDPLFDHTLSLPPSKVVYETATWPPAITSSLTRKQARTNAYPTIIHPTSTSSAVPIPPLGTLADLFSQKNDFLACVKQDKGGYLYLVRALTAWQTSSQLLRDPVPIHNVWLAHRYNITMFSTTNTPSPTLPPTVLMKRQDLIHYHAFQTLLVPSPSLCDAAAASRRLWAQWVQSAKEHVPSDEEEEKAGTRLVVEMPRSWLGPDVTFSALTRSACKIAKSSHG